ncbi:hypothetical protein B296_00016552 [Ensete ventricosum]|uniref:Uncharacterized protein n=1 Tax=Ensete ventricosum TaxID=4639 RepID=A0A426XS61_ENSVE|nr:hypothetical protein B296_00016552 [Ensete ventricosum]
MGKRRLRQGEAAADGNGDWRQVAAMRAGSNGDVAVHRWGRRSGRQHKAGDGDAAEGLQAAYEVEAKRGSSCCGNDKGYGEGSEQRSNRDVDDGLG